MDKNEYKKTGTIDDPDDMALNRFSCKIRQREDGRLWVSFGTQEIPVNINRCFPWSEPFQYISLRDDDGEEVILLADLENMDSVSRTALENALKEAGFLMEITNIISIDEDFEIRNWHVITRQGVRRFQTKLDEWPYEVPGGGLIIKDLAGDLYYIEDPGKMDKNSRRLFWTVSG